MLATFILGIAAGAGTAYAEPHVKKMLDGVVLSDLPLTAMELRMLTFALCMVGAAILAWIFGNGSAFALTVGALIGVFGPRALEIVQKKRREPDYGDDI